MFLLPLNAISRLRVLFAFRFFCISVIAGLHYDIASFHADFFCLINFTISLDIHLVFVSVAVRISFFFCNVNYNVFEFLLVFFDIGNIIYPPCSLFVFVLSLL
jgi:hypothetical protein